MDKLMLVAHGVRDVVEEIALGDFPTRQVHSDDGVPLRNPLEGWWSTKKHSKDAPMSLAGACAYASRILVRALREHGFSAELCVGTFDDCDHCWVVVEGTEPGPLIVDVTASQFSPLFSRVRVAEVFECKADYRTIRRGSPGSSADRNAREFDNEYRVPSLQAARRQASRRIRERLAKMERPQPDLGSPAHGHSPASSL